jgi:hypothetical protein
MVVVMMMMMMMMMMIMTKMMMMRRMMMTTTMMMVANPDRVTAVDERDESRGEADVPSSNILRGEGLLMTQLGASWCCGFATWGMPCRFRYDGHSYLIAENAMDFVWVPSDGFHRTRAPVEYSRDLRRWPEGLGNPGLPNAFEVFRRLYWAQYDIDEGDVGPDEDHGLGCECEQCGGNVD